MSSLEKQVADIFMEMADGIESGNFGKRPKIALTGMGSEHGEENSMAAAVAAAAKGVDVQYIGSFEDPAVTTIHVDDDEAGHEKMDEMLEAGEIDGAVTMHYPYLPYLGLWHMPKTDAPYICIEPWTSLPSRQDIIEDFSCKSDLIRLCPGGRYENGWKATLR